jgi:hypothetical protein
MASVSIRGAGVALMGETGSGTTRRNDSLIRRKSMHSLTPTIVDRHAKRRVRHMRPGLSALLIIPLLLSAGSAWGATIDFEQYSPAGSTCHSPQNPQIGIARFTEGQLATSLPGALDQTTVYWDSFACGDENRMVIEFSVPVSTVQFRLENLETDQATTTYIVHSTSSNNVLHTDMVVLPAPCHSVLCLPQSSTIVTLPYTEIREFNVQPFPLLDWSFLIDDVTFGFPIGLLDTWTRLCVLSISPACPKLQLVLQRHGFTFPISTSTATPTETSTPPSTATPTATPSGCGLSGEQCCPPAVGPPCLVGVCDPASNMCP